MPENVPQVEEKRRRRIWCDGCYDIFHFGHANFLRQAKGLGDWLVVGIHDDEAITKHKGPPVFDEKERLKMLRGIKWVDEIVENATYTPTLATLDDNSCDFCCHGDDVCATVDGGDPYGILKAAGRYQEVPRTAGVSTTDLVGRMLLLTKQHFGQGQCETSTTIAKDSNTDPPYTTTSQFLPSTQTIFQFSDAKPAKPGDKVIYVAGAFDLFHVGHMDLLEKARKHADYLMVGLHTDQVVNRYKGSNYPIMNLHERVLNLLACKFVSEVVIGAPHVVTQHLLDHFKVHVVVHGMTPIRLAENGDNPYALPIKLGKFIRVDSGNSMTTGKVVERIIRNWLAYEARNKNQEKKMEMVKMNERGESME